jgi:hypothetical protein
MSFWVAIDLGMEQCLGCDAIYHVKAHDLPRRSVGQFICQCGREMNSWHAQRTYSYQLISIPPQGRRKYSVFV